MKYKKIIPYMLAASTAILTTGCGEAFEMKNHTATVQSIDKDCWLYCDTDGDKLVDFRMYINSGRGGRQTAYYDYIQVGDTIKFGHGSRDLTGRSILVYPTYIQSVNNRTSDDIKKIYELNKLRTAVGQPKTR